MRPTARPTLRRTSARARQLPGAGAAHQEAAERLLPMAEGRVRVRGATQAAWLPEWPSQNGEARPTELSTCAVKLHALHCAPKRWRGRAPAEHRVQADASAPPGSRGGFASPRGRFPTNWAASAWALPGRDPSRRIPTQLSARCSPASGWTSRPRSAGRSPAALPLPTLQQGDVGQMRGARRTPPNPEG